MRMTPCEKGHYYDQNNHSFCPYCTDSSNTLEDIESIEKTMVYRKREASAIEEVPKTEMLISNKSVSEDDFVTGNEVELTAGWIVVTSLKGRGRNYTLTYGLNTLGRSSSNHISIDNGDNSISRKKHATLIYDFENRVFYIQHNDGKYLSYLNGVLVSGLMELKAEDRIKIGHTEFLFIPLCGEKFSWDTEEQENDKN